MSTPITYLVTGGAGFIGSNYILQLLKQKDDIKLVNLDKLTYAGNLANLKSIENDPRYSFVQADITDKAAVSQIFAQFEPNYVVHFAAESHVDRSIDGPFVFAQTNAMGTLNLLDCAKKCWLQDAANDEYRPGVKFLHVSTDEVYGALGPTGYFTEATPLNPHSPYSASKTASDLFVQAFIDTYQFPANITRCSNNYGPFQFPEKLIPLMYNNAIKNIDLPIYGDGLYTRDWLYVVDHCKAIDLVLEQAKTGEVYNIGGHNERTNLQIVNLIIDYVQQHINPQASAELIKSVTDRKGHDRRYAIDPSKIKADLGWSPATKFEDGIIQTLDWYSSNTEWITSVTSGSYQTYLEQMYKGR